MWTAIAGSISVLCSSAMAERDERLLTGSRGLRIIDIDALQLRTAAQQRARFNVRTPDALQLAAALSSGCTALVTNERRLPEVVGLSVVQLDDAA